MREGIFGSPLQQQYNPQVFRRTPSPHAIYQRFRKRTLSMGLHLS
jgi:hypothetical protein